MDAASGRDELVVEDDFAFYDRVTHGSDPIDLRDDDDGADEDHVKFGADVKGDGDGDDVATKMDAVTEVAYEDTAPSANTANTTLFADVSNTSHLNGAPDTAVADMPSTTPSADVSIVTEFWSSIDHTVGTAAGGRKNEEPSTRSARIDALERPWYRDKGHSAFKPLRLIKPLPRKT